MQYIVISLAATRDEYFRLHRAGCSDATKEIAAGNVPETVEASSAAEAAARYIAGELEEMGYTAADVKIISCAR